MLKLQVSRATANIRVTTILRVTTLLLGCMGSLPAAAAEKHYDPGASDTEVRIGNIAPSTGAFKEYGAVAQAEAAYFQMINDHGGILGRKIIFISLDDGSVPANALPLAQRLIDQEHVLALFSTFGTESNLAIRDLASERRVPQLFVQTSSAAFDDPAHFPWTMGFFPTYRTEAVAYAKYVLQTRPAAKIAVLSEDSAAGREFSQGLRDGLADKAAAMIVREASYANGTGTVTAQIEALKNSGADVFFDFAVGATVTEAIRAAYDSGWRPLQFIANASLSAAAFLDPAGRDKAAGVITSARSKNWLRSQAERDPEVRDYLDWLAKYDPQASLRDQLVVSGYERAEALVAVLKKCGDNLTRANLMAQAASLDLSLGMLRPGIRVRTSPSDYQPIKQLFLIQYDGQQWVSLDRIADGGPGV